MKGAGPQANKEGGGALDVDSRLSNYGEGGFKPGDGRTSSAAHLLAGGWCGCSLMQLPTGGDLWAP